MTSAGDGALRDPDHRVAGLLDIAAAIDADVDPSDLTDVLSLVAGKTARMCHADRCVVHLLSDGGLQAATAQSASGAFDDRWRALKPLRPDECPGFQLALRDARPVVVSEPRGVVPTRWITRFGIRAGLMLPLLRHDRRLGVLHLYNVSERCFGPDDIELGRVIAMQCALLIDNARLAGEARVAKRARRGLLMITQAANAASNVEELVDRVSAATAALVGADACVGYLCGHGATLEPAGAARPTDGWLRRRDTTRYIAALLGTVREPVWSDDIVKDPRLDVVRLHGVRSMLVVPVCSRDHVIGALACTWRRCSRVLSRDDLRLVQALAAYAAIGVVNARLHASTGEAPMTRERVRVVQDQHDRLREAVRSMESRLEQCLDCAIADPTLQAAVEQVRWQTRSLLSEMEELGSATRAPNVS